MAYYIFNKNSENLQNVLYKIAENISDLNNLNIDKNYYTILENNEQNFDAIKSNLKIPVKYIGNEVIFENISFNFEKPVLENYISQNAILIKYFLKANINHPAFSMWNNYHNQLVNLNLNTITYPLKISLEQYFKNNNQPYFNILQLP